MAVGAEPVTGPRLLALWSAPRCRSTAFLRMMIQRGDFTVVHEPFSLLSDFGMTTVNGVLVRSEDALMTELISLSRRAPVFFKDTTDFEYPGLLASPGFLASAVHTFLIRRPADAIASHAALNPGLTCAEVGFERLAAIFDAVTGAGSTPVVMDADDLVAAPAAMVEGYCRAVGIPAMPGALSWPTGMLPAWRTTARWHGATSRTTGFAPPRPQYERTTATCADLAAFRDYHQPFYDRLYGHRLQP